MRQNGVNFSLFSGYATGVELLLFDKHDSPQPFR
jgi:glycogen operon protein